MKTAVITAEYNPFHKGHRWQLEQVRAAGASHVAVVMSPNFAERHTRHLSKAAAGAGSTAKRSGPGAGAAGLLRSGGRTALCLWRGAAGGCNGLCGPAGIWSGGRRPCAAAAGLYRFAAGRGQPEHPTAAAIRYHLCKGKGAGCGCGVWGGNCSAAAKTEQHPRQSSTSVSWKNCRMRTSSRWRWGGLETPTTGSRWASLPRRAFCEV